MSYAFLARILAASVALIYMVGAGEEYEVEGSVKFENFQAPSLDPLTYFRASVAGDKWFIKMNSPDMKLWDTQEAAFDGTNLYYIRFGNPEPQQNLLSSSLVQRQPTTARVYTGKVLHEIFAHTATPVWFAYASAAYLDSSDRHLIEPVIMCPLPTGFYSIYNPIRQRAEVQRDPFSPHLPGLVAFFDDGFTRAFRGNGAPVKRAPPYDKGFTNAIYRAGPFTNVSGVSLPAFASLEIFAPAEPGRRATDLVLHSRYQISLNRAKPVSSVRVFQPMLPPGSAVIDMRFFERYGITVPYRSSSNWATETEIAETKTFKQLRAFQSYAAPQTQRLASNRVLKFGFMFLLCLFPGVFLLLAWHRETRQASYPGDTTANSDQSNCKTPRP